MKHDPHIARDNVRKLLAEQGLNMRQAAEQAGITYKWLRRVCSRGLTRIEARNREQLSKLCELLRVNRPELLFRGEYVKPPEPIVLDDATKVAAREIAESLSEQHPTGYAMWCNRDEEFALRAIGEAIVKMGAENVRSKLAEQLKRYEDRGW